MFWNPIFFKYYSSQRLVIQKMADAIGKRRITEKHRMVYRIFDTEVLVEVLTAYGHYTEK